MNGMEGFNPLTSQHLANINSGCEECARARDYLRKLQAVGHQVDQHLATVDAAESYLKAVKQQFFPGNP